MEEREKVAAGILDRVMDTMFDRNLIANAHLPRRSSDGVAHATARFKSRLKGAKGKLVGDLRVTVLVPQDAAGQATVTVRWTRDGYGFWYEKDTKIGTVKEPENADLVGVGMVLTAVKWTADGTVPLRSMIRAFRKVRKSGGSL